MPEGSEALADVVDAAPRWRCEGQAALRSTGDIAVAGHRRIRSDARGGSPEVAGGADTLTLARHALRMVNPYPQALR
jgi:hypothetical protein